MDFNEATQAIHDAENTIRLGDRMARKVSWLLVHKLRSADIDSEVLAALKRELRTYNIQTGWRDRG